MRWRNNYMPNRLVCTVLEEMRKCNETRNYSYLSGLIEEVQSAVSKMEAALYDQSDLKYAEKQLKSLKKEIEELEDKKEDLGYVQTKNKYTGSTFDSGDL
jgi:uncharacterized protein YPO0396